MRIICGCGAPNYKLSDWWAHKVYGGWGRFFRHLLRSRIEWRLPIPCNDGPERTHWLIEC